MKKIIIILSILLASCTSDVGDLRKRILIITDANISSVNVNSAFYTARSFYGGTYTNSIEFTDDIGKFEVGDTIKIVKR